MENRKKYTITTTEYNGLLYLYYNALCVLENKKGLKYKQAFSTVMSIKNLGRKLEQEKSDIKDLIEVV